MLTQMQIRHFALIDSLDLDFTQGLTVLTGETGSGKSLILKALSLLMGHRIEKTHTAQKTAQLSATFDLKHLLQAQEWLAQQAILDNDNPDICVIRRAIDTKGRSKCFINGMLVTQQQLKQLAPFLLHQHGQHQHTALFKPEVQRAWLDEYGQLEKWLSACQSAYRQYTQLQKQHHTLLQSLQLSDNDKSLLEYQVMELNALALGEHELQSLEEQHAQLSKAQEYQESFGMCVDLLDDSAGARYALNQAIKVLTQSKHPDLPDYIEDLVRAEQTIHDIGHSLRDMREKAEDDPARCQEIEQRLSQIYDVARKHKVKPDMLYEHACQLQNRLSGFEAHQAELEHLCAAIERARIDYLAAAEKLSAKRTAVAKTLGQTISQAMQAINMAGGRCQILVQPKPSQMSLQGIDEVCIEIQPSAGQEMAPLHMMASGGELARIALCIQSSIAHVKATPTLIFDEVDVGVGGQTGALIGQKLKALSVGRQIICITHLPQVAAYADRHCHVIKACDATSTTTEASFLAPTERETELARMLAGTKINDAALNNAKTLLESA